MQLLQRSSMSPRFTTKALSKTKRTETKMPENNLLFTLSQNRLALSYILSSIQFLNEILDHN